MFRNVRFFFTFCAQRQNTMVEQNFLMMKFSLSSARLLIENIFCLLKKHISCQPGNWPAVAAFVCNSLWERRGGVLIKSKRKLALVASHHRTTHIQNHASLQKRRPLGFAIEWRGLLKRRCMLSTLPILLRHLSSYSLWPRRPPLSHPQQHKTRRIPHHRISLRRFFFLPQNCMINQQTRRCARPLSLRRLNFNSWFSFRRRKNSLGTLIE